MFSRVQDFRNGAVYAASMIRRSNEDGLDAQLIVRGAPSEISEGIRRRLAQIAGQEVDIRPYNAEEDLLRADLEEADLVIMPTRAIGFGVPLLDAAIAGIPLLAPTSSGIGILLSDPKRFPADLITHMLIAQGFDEPVPLDRWITKIIAALSDLPATRARAETLRLHLRAQNRTLAGANESLAAIDRATEILSSQTTATTQGPLIHG